MLEAGAGNTMPPNHLWLMQEPSGDLHDGVGATDLQAKNSPTWGDPVTAWSRVAVSTSETAANQGFFTTTTGNLDGTTSYLFLAYVAVVEAPPSLVSLMGLGEDGDHRYVGLTSTPRFVADGVGVSGDVGTDPPGVDVHPVVLEVDATHMQYVVYTDHEKLTSTWKAPQGLGGLLIIGNGAIGAGAAHYLYSALWEGNNAEMDDSAVKSMLTVMGWSVSGY